MSYSEAYDPDDGIAIVGMAGRFPGANDPQVFWRNLVAGRETISRFGPDDLDPGDAEELDRRRDPSYVPARGILEDVDMFDSAFFAIPPLEADVLDPQQRVFLEACWAALEDAGHDPACFHGPIGIFAGNSNNSYYTANLCSRRDVTGRAGFLTTMMGNEKDYLATRTAYKLGLTGPALNIATACSTSLVAVCQAVSSLATYQCDMAVAGGASISLPQRRGYLYQDGAITSPDGHCRAFDQRANGTVFSNGVGVVVLRRLADARANRDNIYAVIKGAALNNDGNSKVSFTAPSVEGHARVIAMAQAQAGIDPDTITYIETHGTGTNLGDPVEIAGLKEAFETGGATRTGSCALGALKTNIGHLDASAGIAGLIKTALAIQHRTLPATLHFESPNPNLELQNTPFFVNATCRPWTAAGTPLRAGVSSFGVGGTNAHVVLEEAPPALASKHARDHHLLVLSARTESALGRQRQRLAAKFKEEPALSLADAAFTLQVGRRVFENRFATVCSSRLDALASLEDQKLMKKERTPLEGVAFLFPGQGAQYAGMGRKIYESEPLFRREIDESCEVLAPILGRDLRRCLFPAADNHAQATEELARTALTQPAMFIIEHALARLWMSWGIFPKAMIGHSLGEYVAATIGGTFARDDALSLVARRAALIQALPEGAMLAVKAQPHSITELLGDGVEIAAYNAPTVVIVSGSNDAVTRFERKANQQSITCRRLHTSHAFHSSMLDPIVGEFEELVRNTPRKPPQLPWISGHSGQPISQQEAVGTDYWVRQLRFAVRFSEGLRQLMDRPLTLLEIGPGRTLTTLVRQHGSRQFSFPVLATLGDENKAEFELGHMLQTLGELWTAGANVDWHAFNRERSRCLISLPTYPFERTRHWVEPQPSASNLVPQTPYIHAQMSVPATPMTAVSPPPAANIANARPLDHVIESLQQLFSDLSGINSQDIDPAVPFLDLGLDSLVLTQAAAAINKRFSVKMRFRELLDEYGTIAAIAARIEELTPQGGAAAPPAQAVNPPQNSSTVAQKPLLKIAPTAQTELQAGKQNGVSGPAEGGSVQSFGPFRPVRKAPRDQLSNEQQVQLSGFMDRYGKRTERSKELSDRNRSHLSDPRSVAGFRQVWKEIVYPIATTRSLGGQLWDVDGNEYVDLVNGFGSIFFGHNPEFIRTAVKAQMDAGIEIGPQSPLAGEVARHLCEAVGMQRAAFCNTGSEAVAAAIRTARCVTGRDRIIYFAGSYHGIFDEVLMRPRMRDDKPRSAPIAPGIPETDNVIVLEYGDPSALEVIKAQADNLAAVLVEPVQSRRPELQPREFLRELRRITQDMGTALIFDEVVTGFRVHPGGMQSVFGVKADLATYGKVIGGGLPIGVLAGDCRFLDALDGGVWRYGDNSRPEVGVTFFAGTFVRHPLALAAAQAVLTRLHEGGPELQRQLNLRASAFADRMTAIAAEVGAPVALRSFSSWFMLDVPQDAPLASLLFAFMRYHGVHLWEGRPGFLTHAHTETDLDHIAKAFRRSLEEMMKSGFLRGEIAESPPVVGAKLGKDANGRKAWFVPDPNRAGKYLEVKSGIIADV